jgi:hypothetical protein
LYNFSAVVSNSRWVLEQEFHLNNSKIELPQRYSSLSLITAEQLLDEFGIQRLDVNNWAGLRNKFCGVSKRRSKVGLTTRFRGRSAMLPRDDAMCLVCDFLEKNQPELVKRLNGLPKDTYIVERILEHKDDKFRVKWEGYDETSWISEEDFVDADGFKSMLAAFRRDINERFMTIQCFTETGYIVNLIVSADNYKAVKYHVMKEDINPKYFEEAVVDCKERKKIK